MHQLIYLFKAQFLEARTRVGKSGYPKPENPGTRGPYPNPKPDINTRRVSGFQNWLFWIPTSIESERKFSITSFFGTKLCSRLDDETLSALQFLKYYYKKDRKSKVHEIFEIKSKNVRERPI